MIEAVIFDFGGVIITSPIGNFRALEIQNGIPEGSIAKLNMQNHHDNAWARFERSEIDLDTFVLQFEQEAKNSGFAVDPRALIGGSSNSLNQSMVDALTWLKGRYKLALLTNNFSIASNLDWLSNVVDMFDVVVESSKVGMRKPEERIYHRTLDLLGTEAERTVFLDDLGVNLKTARALGIHTIKVANPESALEELWQMLGDRPKLSPA